MLMSAGILVKQSITNIYLCFACDALVQVAKLLIIPFVCVVELVWLKRRFTGPVIGSVLTVIIGVGIV